MTSASEAAVDALVREMLVALPADAARELERFTGADAAAVLADVEPAAAARIFERLSHSIARATISAMPAADAARVLVHVPPPWVAALLRALPEQTVGPVLAAAPPPARAAISRAMQHRPATAGALLEPAVLSLPAHVDAESALERAKSPEISAPDRVYVVDRAGLLVGVCGVAELLRAPPHSVLSSLMRTNVAALRVDDDLAAIAEHSGWRSWRTLPVVDRNGMLQGVVRYDTLLRLVLDHPPSELRGSSLPISLAELFWLGMVGMTDGLARTVGASKERHDD